MMTLRLTFPAPGIRSLRNGLELLTCEEFVQTQKKSLQRTLGSLFAIGVKVAEFTNKQELMRREPRKAIYLACSWSRRRVKAGTPAETGGRFSLD
jgi:hypothetical protein